MNDAEVYRITETDFTAALDSICQSLGLTIQQRLEVTKAFNGKLEAVTKGTSTRLETAHTKLKNEHADVRSRYKRLLSAATRVSSATDEGALIASLESLSTLVGADKPNED